MLRAKRSYGSVLCGAVAACALLLVVFASPASADLTYGVGWSGDYAGTENEMNEIAHSGGTILRLPFDLSRCNGNNWGPCDSLVEKAALKGLTILPGLSWTKNGHNRFLLSADPDWPTWGAWSQEVFERYGINGDFWYQHPGVPSHAIDAWEVWNEPNLTPNNPILAGGEEKVQPQNYGRFLKYTSEKVQAASLARTGHGTEILFGGLNMLAGNSISFLESASGVAGVPAAYTAVSIHPYSFDGLVQEMTEKVNSVRSALDDNKRVSGGSGKPLWITELGWPVGGEGAPFLSEAEQASQLTQSINWLKVAKDVDSIRAVVWYDQRDLGGQTHWDYFCGLRRVDGSYRPSWWAFQKETGVAPWPSPTVETMAASELRDSEATLNGLVNPNGAATSFHFEYGTTTDYGSVRPVPDVSVGEGGDAMSESTKVSGLQPGTLYHFRIVATNVAGTSYGPDRTFVTLTGPRPVVGPGSQQAFYYRGTDGALWQGIWSGSQWQFFNLGGSVAGNPSPVVGPNSQQAVYYRGTDGAVWQAIFNTTLFQWETFRLGGSPAGDPVAIVGPGSQQAFYYRGTDGALWQGIWSGSQWQFFNLGGSVAGNPSPVVGPNSQQAVYYRGTDGAVWQAIFNTTLFQWETFRLGGSPAGDPVAIVGPGSQQAFYYRGTDGALWQGIWGGSQWQFFNLGGSVAGNPSPVVGPNSQQAVYYRGTDGAVWQAIFNTTLFQWETFRLGGSPAGDPVAIVGPGSQQAFYYAASSGSGVWQGIWSGSQWQFFPLGGSL